MIATHPQETNCTQHEKLLCARARVCVCMCMRGCVHTLHAWSPQIIPSLMNPKSQYAPLVCNNPLASFAYNLLLPCHLFCLAESEEIDMSSLVSCLLRLTAYTNKPAVTDWVLKHEWENTTVTKESFLMQHLISCLKNKVTIKLRSLYIYGSTTALLNP